MAMKFKVNCFDVVSTNKVELTDTKSGEKFYAQALEWRWRNSFFADVTFVFRGQKFIVSAEVHPEYNN